MNSKWTKQEVDFIRANVELLSDKDGAEKLSAIVGHQITLNAYRKKRQEMGYKKARGRGICKLEIKEDAETTRVD